MISSVRTNSHFLFFAFHSSTKYFRVGKLKFSRSNRRNFAIFDELNFFFLHTLSFSSNYHILSQFSTQKEIKNLFFLSFSHPSLPKQNIVSVRRELKSKHRLREFGIFLWLGERFVHGLVCSFYFGVLSYWHSDTIMLVLSASTSSSTTCLLFGKTLSASPKHALTWLLPRKRIETNSKVGSERH